MDSDKSWKDLYLEIALSGSLRASLADELAAIDPSLSDCDTGEFSSSSYARVEHSHRFSQVYVAANERLFLADFWLQGVDMAHGNCDDLTEIAAAIALWHAGTGCSTAIMSMEFSWVEPTAWAEAHEAGNAVEWKWKSMLTRGDYPPAMRAAILRASQEPALRQLFPFTSMSTLCFSRCTGYPFTRDMPSITPGSDDAYVVRNGDDTLIASAALGTVISLVVEHLPPDCGPAWQGTAEDEEKGE